jgi:hypothetical protein
MTGQTPPSTTDQPGSLPARDLPRDLRWGVAHGLAFAAFCSLWASILYLARDSDPFRRLGVTFERTIILYFAGGIGGGLLMGLCRPLTMSRRGRLWTGLVIGPMIALGICLLLFGSPRAWGVAAVLTILIWSAVMGTGVLLQAET